MAPESQTNPRWSKLEYRVAWKREGLAPKRRIYQTRQGAEDFIRVMHQPNEDEPGDHENPSWVHPHREIAEFEDDGWPTLQEREVGEWRDA